MTGCSGNDPLGASCDQIAFVLLASLAHPLSAVPRPTLWGFWVQILTDVWGQPLSAAALSLSQSHPLLQTPAPLGEDPGQRLHHHPFAVGKAGATDMALAVPHQLHRIKPPTPAFLGAPLSSPYPPTQPKCLECQGHSHPFLFTLMASAPKLTTPGYVLQNRPFASFQICSPLPCNRKLAALVLRSVGSTPGLVPPSAVVWPRGQLEPASVCGSPQSPP